MFAAGIGSLLNNLGACCSISANAGRTESRLRFVYSGQITDMNTLTHSNVEIKLLVPDDIWFSAPAERTPRFKPVFMKVARALHQSLRDTLAPMFFEDLRRLADIEDAYPLLFYYASRPHHSKTEFFWDVLEEGQMEKFFRLTIPRLREVMADVYAKLNEAGLPEIAQLYRPIRLERIVAAVRTRERFRRRLYQMLVSEAHLFTALTCLGGVGGCLSRVQTRRTAAFVKEWNSILRRFYANRDFTAAGPVILRAATIALVTALRTDSAFEDEDLYEQAA